MSIIPQGYYSRHDPSKNYEQHMFVGRRVLQSPELNEIQQHAAARLKDVADVLFKDGDVIRDARIVVDAVSGETLCESGALYLRGAVRGVTPATLSIPVDALIAVGVYLQESVITELEDPSLKNPVKDSRSYQEPGALRLRLTPVWGYQGDGQEGEFFPVYQVDHGSLVAKEPPPNIDAVTNAIASYDRQSTGGSYVVEGLNVSQLADVNGKQVYSVQEGQARVFGRAVSLPAARRLTYSAAPDLGRIDSEPYLSTTAAAQRINTDRAPIAAIVQVRITKETTANIVHGQFTGAQDALPDTAVLEIVSVTQGGTTYVNGTDYKLTAGKVDWSLSGDEPALGSQYVAVYRHIATVPATDIDATGFTVTGAVVGTLVQTTYDWKRPRYDRLCLTPDGMFEWIKGIPANDSPSLPAIPSGQMLLATVHQTWTADRSTRNDGVRVIPMQDIETIRSNVSELYDLMAEQKLMLDASSREPAAKKGLFVDAFRSNARRDAGVEQDAVLDGGELVLPIGTVVGLPSSSITAPQTLVASHAVRISQIGRTGSMKVNPYMAFDPIPVPVQLTPSVDHFVQETVSWAASVWGSSPRTELVSSARTEHALRQIAVSFVLSGFGAGESLTTVTFDGLDVTNTVVGS